ncbi:hypothetical protein [Melioribacter sp. OK-6-Me]|uniref:hypothetical protein n=1 Tax=unclassified Melioribacter TaxID=2627329 RepID=UPI003EDAE8BA
MKNTFNHTIKFIILVQLVLYFYLFIHYDIIHFNYISLISSLLYIPFAIIILKYEIDRKTIYFGLTVAILIRILFINNFPLGSDDIYRYIWDGKVQYNGINPYLYPPDASQLSHLSSEMLPDKVNFPDMKTIYFPLSQWLFYTAYLISGESVWGLKLLMILFEIITMASTLYLLKLRGLNFSFVLLYALCPLILIHIGIDAHLDGYGFTFFALFLFFYLQSAQKNRWCKIISLIFLGFALSIKPAFLIALPAIFWYETDVKRKIIYPLIPVAILGIQFIPYLSTPDLFQALQKFARNWTFNGSIFNIINAFLEHNQKSRLICLILYAISFAAYYLFMKRRKIEIDLYYTYLLLLLFSPVVHPWYIGWLIVLLPVVPRLSGIFYASLSSTTIITVMNYQLYGYWKEYPLLLVVEYLPVLIFLMHDLIFVDGRNIDSKN